MILGPDLKTNSVYFLFMQSVFILNIQAETDLLEHNKGISLIKGLKRWETSRIGCKTTGNQ